MSKHKRMPPWLVKVAAIVFLVCLLLIAIATYSGGTYPGFQEYKPTSLPAGLNIKDSELYVQRYPQFLPSFSRHIDLDFNLANSWIEENKSDGVAFYNSWCQNYLQGLNCRQYQTPLHQNYLLSTYTTNSAGQVGQELYFIKNDTSIDITLTGYSKLSQQGWGKIIDSFQPTHYSHPQIFRGSTRGP